MDNPPSLHMSKMKQSLIPSYVITRIVKPPPDDESRVCDVIDYYYYLSRTFIKFVSCVVIVTMN